jgi:hypothetical protein
MDLEKILTSRINAKILKLFCEHPHCIDTAQGISLWTGLPLDKTKNSLQKLAHHSLLVEHKTLSTQGYALTQDKKIITAIKNWLNRNPSDT